MADCAFGDDGSRKSGTMTLRSVNRSEKGLFADGFFTLP